MKKLLLFLIFMLPLGVFVGCTPASGKPDGAAATGGETTKTPPPTEQETEPSGDKPEDAPSLYKSYADEFMIGVALPDGVLAEWNKYGGVITQNFNSITCENEMKPDFILDRTATVADVEGNYTSPKVKFSAPSRAVKCAVENGMKMRLHTLVWHAQTPAWFFTEDYTDDGELVSREVMLARMESYIRSVLEYYGENYPGLIYAVDVVNEAFDGGDGDGNGVRMKNNKWYETIGPDYVYWAFYYARKYAPEGARLFYNDYACMWKVDMILGNLKKAKDEGLIDGIGMQSHLSVGDPVPLFCDAIKRFAAAGYEVQLTELDVGIKGDTEANFKAQGKFYRELMTEVVGLRRAGVDITSVTVWGLSDELTWRRGEFPLLLDGELGIKPAYEGFLAASEE